MQHLSIGASKLSVTALSLSIAGKFSVGGTSFSVNVNDLSVGSNSFSVNANDFSVGSNSFSVNADDLSVGAHGFSVGAGFFIVSIINRSNLLNVAARSNCRTRWIILFQMFGFSDWSA
ncbi:hypothetical protein OYT88_14725 [Sporolactobacillus sp. CQH2019]|uniref:hypothetical protein n=1 Tax=Sporolactobacillus sp. CQH2019 TaxID=3023512 RepID=UPI002368671E|nr:hypothetical protein [Sporolactobacillus sp. CQH2019]MDD9149806.1 hypothetical protein [Sporolactobacillus sp. CQH2019]